MNRLCSWLAGLLAVLSSVAVMLIPPKSAPNADTAVMATVPLLTSAGRAEAATGKVVDLVATGNVVGSVAISCRGTVRARITNRTAKRVVVTVWVGKKAHRISVRSGTRQKYITHGRARARVVLKAQGKALDRARVPQRCAPVAGFPTPQSVGPRTTPTATYSGSCTVTTDNLVIENVVVKCQATGLLMGNVNGDAPPNRSVRGVVIRNAVINGGVFTSFGPTDPESEDDAHPLIFSVVSSRVISGAGPLNDRAVGFAHFSVRDSYLQGSHSGLWAHNKAVIQGSYITTDGTDSHQSGLRMLKNSTLRGSTVYCKPLAGSTGNDTSGCSANAVFYREYGVPANLTIEGNYFPYDAARGGGYYATRFIDCHENDDCVNIKMIGNVFDRGQGTDGGEFPNDAGDVWADNRWTDGRPARSGQTR